ncbi:hypothetical protein BJX61DRAFT_528760 [Aspergillus egyptiacus]|nr:hypothetical protein BJX61DRAFT_528760 [Aspergillus egyptiacus]
MTGSLACWRHPTRPFVSCGTSSSILAVPCTHPMLSDCLRLLRACSGRAQAYSVSKKQPSVSTKTEREGHQAS